MDQYETTLLEPARASIHRSNYFNIADSILNGDGIYWHDRFVELCSFGDTRNLFELVNRLKESFPDFSIDCCHSKTGDTGLIAACKNRHYETVEVLLHLGVDPTVRNAARQSVLDFCTEDTQLRNLILTADCHLPSTAKCGLTFSTWSGNTELFTRYLHLTEVDMKHIDDFRNANGMPLLLLAVEDIDLMSCIAKDGHLSNTYHPEQLVAKLIDIGVDVNISNSSTGKTALHYLAHVDGEIALNIMRQIIETRQANLSSRDFNENTPLHSACGSGNEAAAVLLVHEGSDVNARGSGGQTPLHLSANIGSQDLVRILLDCGADVTLIDDKGLTAFDVANDNVVRTSLREAWTEATARKRSSSDLESSDDDGLLARSGPSSLLGSSGDIGQVGGKLRTIRSLPVLPSISPTSPTSADQKVVATTPENVVVAHSTSSQSLVGLAGIEAIIEKHSSGKTMRASCKPRLRRWRSTSAGCIASAAGVRLPPLHMAIFEVGIAENHKLRPASNNRTRPQTTPELESSQEESTRDVCKQSCKPASCNRIRTLQTTMPCRVSVPTLMILGARPPQMSMDMSVESVSARSVATPYVTASRDNKVITDNNNNSNTASEKVCEKLGKVKKQPNPRCGKSKPVTADCRSANSGSTKQAKPVCNKGLVRRHSVTSVSPERVITTKPSPPKDIPPMFPKFEFTPASSLMESVLQPALKIEPIYSAHDKSSDDERRSEKSTSKGSCKITKKKKPACKDKVKENNNCKKAKKGHKGKAGTAKNGQKSEDSRESSFTASDGEGRDSSPVTLMMGNGVTLRLPLDSDDLITERSEDNNSLRALSDIIQLSTVVEEDELLASIRSSYAKITSRLAQMPIIAEPNVNDEQQVAEQSEPNLDDDGDDEETSDATSVNTMTPDDREEMERELMELGSLPEPKLATGTGILQPLIVDDDDEDEFVADTDEEESARLVRAASRASATRNPVVFEEDETLAPDGNDALGNSTSSSAPVIRANSQDVQLGGDAEEENVVEPIPVAEQPASVRNSQVEESPNPPPRSWSRASTGSEQLQQSVRWRKGNEIGHGGYGKVYLALTSLGGLIAVKQIDTSRFSRDAIEKEYERIDEEINILRALKHPGIVEFYGTSFEGDVVNIFMEFIAGGSVASILKRFGALEETVFRRYTKQLLKAVTYLHGAGIVHRDIKGANIMVSGEGQIKLIDFGCARRLVESAASESSIGHDRSGAQLKSAKGTPYWMAPEVICETGHGRKSDIWSIGCTVFEMAMRRPPWAELEPSAAMFAIASGRKPVPQLPSANFTPDAVAFAAACLNRQPSARPTAAELLEHKWFLASASHRRTSNQPRRSSARVNGSPS